MNELPFLFERRTHLRSRARLYPRLIVRPRSLSHFWRGTGRWLMAALIVTAIALPAHAAGGGTTLEINTMLDKVLKWMSGSLAITIGTIAMVAAAFVWMFLRHERGADFAFRALLGTAIAIGAANMVETFLGSGATL